MRLVLRRKILVPSRATVTVVMIRSGPGAMPSIRPARLNMLLEAMKSQQPRYLEIGIASGATLLAVEANEVLGVDPRPSLEMSLLPDHVRVIQTSSDEFFRDHAEGLKFDLVYLDGLHEWKQTLRDFQNSLKLLNPGGIILIDDVHPTDRWSADPDPEKILEARSAGLVEHGRWYGDVYKTVMAIAETPRSFGLATVGRGPGAHAQTIVWATNHTLNEATFSLSQVDINRLDSITYEEAFSSTRTPRFYNFKRESRNLYRRIARAALDSRPLERHRRVLSN